MPNFNFSYPVEVRYGDIDSQGHLNHAKYLTFMEHARYKYIEQVGLWRAADGYEHLGQIIANVTCDYKRPVRLGETVDVAARTVRVGTKSLEMEFRLTVAGEEVALGRSVQVAYDYQAAHSIPVPDEWRALIGRFEAWPA
jgi:acyl-CoA thioester hydrolase